MIGDVRSNLSGLKQGNLGIPLMLLVMLGMVMLPIPPFLLDVLFTFSIALSIVVLLVAIYALRLPDHSVGCHLAAFGAQRRLNAGGAAQWAGWSRRRG
jgi:flagellar biosynthesis protein FlhA